MASSTAACPATACPSWATRMAQRVGEHFTGGDFTVRALVRSPLLRTAETIAPLASALGMEPREDPRVIEAANRFEGQHAGAANFLQLKNLPLVYNPLRPSWGEPYTAQVVRMRAAMATLRRELEAIARDESLDTVDGVIVSHQLPIWVTRLAAQGRPLVHDPRRRECALASVTTFTYEGGKLAGVHYDDVSADLQPAKNVAGA
jgi:broad specificity phosphatase PhoE